MRVRIAAACLAAAAMLTFAACSMRGSSGDLKPGMTPDQAVAALGQPDLKDRVVDPHHKGVELMRFVWLDTGKVAMFGPNNQLAKVDSIAPATSQNGAGANNGASNTDAAATTKVETPQEVQREVRPQQAFDPIETPFSYLFYPIRAAFIYLGAGLNCVGGGGCAAPELPPPQG
jgi:hypothetical protein